jgi:hypothetical protein
VRQTDHLPLPVEKQHRHAVRKAQHQNYALDGSHQRVGVGKHTSSVTRTDHIHSRSVHLMATRQIRSMPTQRGKRPTMIGRHGLQIIAYGVSHIQRRKRRLTDTPTPSKESMVQTQLVGQPFETIEHNTIFVDALHDGLSCR